MCARQIYRNLLITLLLLPLLGSTSSLFAATRGIQVVSKIGHPIYLYKDYHAIVIGISEYEYWPSLPNAVKEAEEVTAKLKQLGFKVKLIRNPDSRELKSTLSYMVRRLGKVKNRALLFYFAGHGETTELADGTELGFIVPKDCPPQNVDPFGFDSKAVSMREIEMLALRVKSKHMLMLFDSCFSGSLFTLARAAPTDITEKSAHPVRQFITAGGADETVPDRSIFKVCLIRALEGEADYNRDNYVTGSELGMYLQNKVVNYSRGAQHPQYGKINNPYLDRGDFIFIPTGLQTEVSPAPPEGKNQLLAPKRDQLKSETVKEPTQKQLKGEGFPDPILASLEAEHQRIDRRYKLRHKLAIFPWIEKRDSVLYRNFLIDALNRSIEKTEVFVPIFSYYELNNSYNTKVIRSLMTEYPAGTLFTKTWKGVSKPRIDFICELGNELKVDAVFASYSRLKNMHGGGSDGTAGTYLDAYIELSLIDVMSARNHKRVIKGAFQDLELRLLMEKSLLELFAEFSKKAN